MAMRPLDLRLAKPLGKIESEWEGEPEGELHTSGIINNRIQKWLRIQAPSGTRLERGNASC